MSKNMNAEVNEYVTFTIQTNKKIKIHQSAGFRALDILSKCLALFAMTSEHLNFLTSQHLIARSGLV